MAFDLSGFLNSSSQFQNIAGGTIQDQLALVTRDAALQVAGLQAGNIIGQANNQADLVDYNAMFAQQQGSYLQTYLRGQTNSAIQQGQGQLGKVRASIAGSGLALAGTSADVYRNEQVKVNTGLQGIQQQGLNQMNQINNQVANLRSQSSLLRSNATSEADLLMKQTDLATHRFI